MAEIEVIPTQIPEVRRIRPRVFGDARGHFLESWNRRDFAAAGIAVDFVQDNHSRSGKGTLRGLHYQIEKAQGKLVSVVSGVIFDVAVDLRQSAPSFGQWVGTELSGETHEMLFIPAGFAHGFLVLSDTADVLYKCTDYYAPAHERVIRWNDPELAIDWPLPGNGAPILSDRDAAGAGFGEAETFA